MTKDDIIRMAREAGLSHFYDSEGHCTGITDAKLVDLDEERNDKRLVEMLAPFAKLVAEHKRKQIIASNAPEIEKINAHIKALEVAVLKEREACAELCEMLDVANPKGKSWDEGTIDCANAIRARGQA